MYQSILYAGASTDRSDLGLGAGVVLKSLDVVENPEFHRVFFDNFFSSYKVIKLLLQRNFAATGIVRNNRIENCPLKSEKDLQKEGRGAFDARCDSKTKITVVRWNDNSIVNVISNCLSVNPIQKVKRYDRKQQKEVTVDQPHMVHEYIQYMGGVDILDNGIANYRIKIRGKKWYWPIFTNCLDSMIVNAWRFYNMVNEGADLSQLKFRQNLVLTFLKGDIYDRMVNPENEEELRELYVQRGRPSAIELPNDVRKDNVGHLIYKDVHGQRRRCRACHSQTIYMCAKCDVPLHPDCFYSFHVDNQ